MIKIIAEWRGRAREEGEFSVNVCTIFAEQKRALKARKQKTGHDFVQKRGGGDVSITDDQESLCVT